MKHSFYQGYIDWKLLTKLSEHDAEVNNKKTIIIADNNILLAEEYERYPIFRLLTPSKLQDQWQQEAISQISKWIAEVTGDINSKSITEVNILNFVALQPKILADYKNQIFVIFKALTTLKTVNVQFIDFISTFDPVLSLSIGLGLSIAKEASKIKYADILIESDSYDNIAEILVSRLPWIINTITKNQPNKQYLLKDDLLYTKEYIYEIESKRKVLLKEKGVYIIFGLAKLAYPLIELLTKKYNAAVYVFGKSELSAENQIKLKAVKVKGFILFDPDNQASLSKAWNYLEKNENKINGIFQLAGCIDDQLFVNKGYQSFLKVLQAKVELTLMIDQVAAATKLDFLLSYGSLSGVVGNLGQSDYAAANAFLNEFMRHRAKLVTEGKRFGKSININWGLWQTGRMKMLANQPWLTAMESSQALQALETIDCEQVEHIIFSGDLTVIESLFFADYKQSDKEYPHHKQALDAPQDQDKTLKDKTIAWINSVVYKYTKLQLTDLQQSIIDLGADSISAISIATEVEMELNRYGQNIQINKTIIFDYPSVFSLAEYIFSNYKKIITSKFVSNKGNDIKTNEHKQTALLDKPNQAPKESLTKEIAIIGIAGRFPQADNIEEFWEHLVKGEDCIEIIPNERWDWRKDYAADPKQAGKAYGRHGGFIRNIKAFDSMFFNISPVEAEQMDPQERILLENVYHAFEDAGLNPYQQGEVGTFVAAMFGHYRAYLAKDIVIDSSLAALANRISYHYNFTGPSIALDTMCSGSLHALHLALMHLRERQCKLAVVSGVNLMPNPVKYRLLSRGKFLSPTGRCHAFGANADGYVPGEGVISLILKPLSIAEKDNDRIYGVIKGSAIASGGKTAGFTVPQAGAQEKVIRKALVNAQVDPASISYIEAHGTGTQLGDPIELQALEKAYAVEKSENNYFVGKEIKYCGLGSVKTNIGHLESAAGMAGIVKILLQFREQTLVPSINANLLNPMLDFTNSKFELIRSKVPWIINNNFPRRAGISSFGAGGSNAHVILEEAQVGQSAVQFKSEFIFLFSAKTNASLHQFLEDMHKFVTKKSLSIDLYAMAYTLAQRPQYKHREAIVAASLVSFSEQLENILKGYKGHRSYKIINADLENYRQAYLVGEQIDCTKIFHQRKVCHLPGYCFENIEHWSQAFIAETNGSVTADNLSLIGDKDIISNFAETRWELQTLTEKITQTNSNNHVLNLNLWNKEEDLLEQIFLVFQEILKTSGKKLIVIYYQNINSTAASYMLEHYQSLTGLLKSLVLENSDLHIKLIELTGMKDDSISGIINNELNEYKQKYQWIKYNTNGRFVAVTNLHKVEFSATTQFNLKTDGIYVITGGLGGIGKKLAVHLLANKAKVILLGRSSIADKQKELVEFAPYAEQVYYYSVDLLQRLQTEQVIQEIISAHGNINGIFHAAGINNDKLFREKDFASFKQVVASKVAGIKNLDIALAGHHIDFLVLFSSVSSCLGNVGQTDYAMANAYLDHFAGWRNSQVSAGLRFGRTVSINWPLWLDTGMKISEEQILYIKEQFGIVPLTVAQGLASLAYILGEYDQGQYFNVGIGEVIKEVIAVFPGDFTKIKKYLASQFLLNDSIQTTTHVAKNDIEEQLKLFVVEILKLDIERIEITGAFGDYGFDSVRLQTFVELINGKYKLHLPPNIFFTFNNIDKLSKHLLSFAEVQRLPEAEPHSFVVENKNNLEDLKNSLCAIVGMDGMFPGANSLARFWQNMLNKVDVIKPMADRWPDRQHYGAVLEHIAAFDNKFFGFSAREAMLMDPQHRLFLQVAYNTILDAGYNPKTLKKVGVFVGLQFNDYQILLQQWKQSRHPYAATGNAHAMLANRVSYLFDFNGPSQTIDTACSSSLVALNRAMLALQHNECDYALVGGVSLLIDPEVTDAAKSMGVLSPNHRCATFSADADGYVRGEGVACVMLKRYEQASKDKDHCYALIANIAENHGGKAHSLTAPNPMQQTELLKKIYQNNNLAKQISYYEAHGTGTKLGDPIEIDAILSAWQQLGAMEVTHKIKIGSVKTHIGHLEPAAGIASIIKVLLAMQHRTIPGNMNFSQLNPYIKLTGTPFEIAVNTQPWQAEGPLTAAISSFGFGGSNVHVVLQQAPNIGNTTKISNRETLVTISAKTIGSFKRMLLNLAEFILQKEVELNLYDLAYTLNVGREHFQYRQAFIVHMLADLQQQLLSLATDLEGVEMLSAVKVSSESRLFPDRDDWNSCLQLAKKDYLAGYLIEWDKLHENDRHNRLSLPTYAFDTKDFWFEQAADSAMLREVIDV